MSTRDTIRKSRPKVESFSISSGNVFVRALSGEGRAKYMRMAQEAAPLVPDPYKIAGLGLCDENGTLAYDIDKPEDLAELKEMDGHDADALAVKVIQLSGLTREALEEAEKKSAASPNASGGTGSQESAAAA